MSKFIEIISIDNIKFTINKSYIIKVDSIQNREKGKLTRIQFDVQDVTGKHTLFFLNESYDDFIIRLNN